tara:strand:+ start:341 stop:718 length:378 start_codon:yes stop_codon:yes gene_type:complete
VSPINGQLSALGLSNDLVLPFLLVWYGWLSKEQAGVAKKRRLIVIKCKLSAEPDGGCALLTGRGRRKLKAFLATDVDHEMGYAYATYLKEYGKVSSDRWCMYAGTPLGGGASGFDWYHNMEILMP